MEQIKNIWSKIDPKLKYTILTAAVTYALAKAAINLDPATSAIVSGVVASVVGYRVENDGTVLRSMPTYSSEGDAGGLDPLVLDNIDPYELASVGGSDDAIAPAIDEEADLRVAA